MRWPGSMMTARDAARVVLVVLLFVTVQETLMLDLRVGGVHPDIMVLLPIVAGIAGGPARGATMGFGAGLVADLFLPTPFGLSALVGSLVGFGVGVATLALDRSALWLPPVAALAGVRPTRASTRCSGRSSANPRCSTSTSSGSWWWCRWPTPCWPSPHSAW